MNICKISFKVIKSKNPMRSYPTTTYLDLHTSSQTYIFGAYKNYCELTNEKKIVLNFLVVIN